MNRLHYGDCLTAMQGMRSESVDLIYLDPPFNSNRDYTAIYTDETGRPLPDQIEAFSDLWALDEERNRAIEEMPVLMREAGIDHEAAEFWTYWRRTMRKAQPSMLAYMSYMTERLLPMRRILKPTGSIYLHCDATASHYIKVMMDCIFGPENFRREIIWNLQTASGYKTQIKGFVRGHDTILYYVRNPRKFTFSKQYTPHKPEYIARFKKKDEDGRRYRDDRPGGRRQYLNQTQGVLLTDVWSDIMSFQQAATSSELMGYATQKPVALLERIIAASSNEGDLVFDPFCGCATTIEAAHKLKRSWIGIDIAIHAIKRVAKVRLQDRLGLVEDRDFEISGIPHTLEGARDLWERDKYHFQKWAVEQIDGFVTTRRTADGGIDGRLYFDAPPAHDLQSMVLEVKGGKNVNVRDVRDLRGVLERDAALMAGLIVMEEPGTTKTRNFKREMAAAGDLEVLGMKYPKMQMLTVSEILEGKRFSTPSVARGRVISAPTLPFGSKQP